MQHAMAIAPLPAALVDRRIRGVLCRDRQRRATTLIDVRLAPTSGAKADIS